MDYIVVLCTIGNREQAMKIANILVECKLVACVNIVPQVISVYKWEDKIQNDEESLMIMKTKRELFENLKDKITQIHPYETPEIIALEITEANQKYLKWINQETI